MRLVASAPGVEEVILVRCPVGVPGMRLQCVRSSRRAWYERPQVGKALGVLQRNDRTQAAMYIYAFATVSHPVRQANGGSR